MKYDKCPKCEAKSFNGAVCYSCGYRLPRILTIVAILTIVSVAAYALGATGL
jgi:hypothetical protein